MADEAQVEAHRQSVQGLKQAQLVTTSKIREGPGPMAAEQDGNEKNVRESVAFLANSKIVSRARGAENDDVAHGLDNGGAIADLRAAIAEVDEQQGPASIYSTGASSAASGTASTPVITPAVNAWAPIASPSTPLAGVGLRFRPSSQGIRVLSTSPGGPADKSGKLKEGDVIMSVEGKIVKNLELDQIVQLLSGTHGSTCKMVKLNEGLEPEYIVLIREIFSRVPSS